MPRSQRGYADASTSTQGLRADPQMSAECNRIGDLEKRVQNRQLEVEVWRDSYTKVVNVRDEALLREERAQWMRIGAETRLKELEIKYSQTLDQAHQRDEEHAKEVAQLKEAVSAKVESGGSLREVSRAMGRIDEMIRSLDDLYECRM